MVTTSQIIWTIVIVLAVLVLIGLIVAVMRKKSLEDKRVRAQQLRVEADGNAAGLPDAQARADQAATQAEHKRLEAERAEKEALRVRTEVDQERARHEDQLRAADRLDPDVNHKSKDYSPQVADPAGPSNIPSDPIHADPATGRAPGATSTSDSETIFDRDDRDDRDDRVGTSTTGSSTTGESVELTDTTYESTDTTPRDDTIVTNDGTLRDRLDGGSASDSDPTLHTETGTPSNTTSNTETDSGGSHRAP